MRASIKMPNPAWSVCGPAQAWTRDPRATVRVHRCLMLGPCFIGGELADGFCARPIEHVVPRPASAPTPVQCLKKNITLQLDSLLSLMLPSTVLHAPPKSNSGIATAQFCRSLRRAQIRAGQTWRARASTSRCQSPRPLRCAPAGCCWSDAPQVHMFAGAMAGMFEHIVMFPVDVVKACILHAFARADAPQTRMQKLRQDTHLRCVLFRRGYACKNCMSGTCTIPSGAWRTLRDTRARGRFSAASRLWRSVRPVMDDAMLTLPGAGPAHALYFAAYEQAKHISGAAQDPSSHPIATGARTPTFMRAEHNKVRVRWRPR